MADPALSPPRGGTTIPQLAVLAGGMATRLGTLAQSTPKPLLPCGDRPFLAWLLREFARFGVRDVLLLTGHLSDQVEAAREAILAHLPPDLRLTVNREPAPAGTAGALFHARHLLDARFLLCNGDSLLNTNLAPLLADAQDDPPEMLGRMLLRPIADASRYGVATREGQQVTAFHDRPLPGATGAGLINAGIGVFRREILDGIPPICSLEREVLPMLAARGALRGTVADGYFIDIGIPEDLARAQAELPATLHRPALLLDRDGVINIDHGWVGTRERFEWMPGAKDAIAHVTRAGWQVFVVTNQSGIARGLYSEADLQSLHRWMVDEIRASGGNIDDIRYCPYHPEGVVAQYRRASDWRKPGPGMILDLIRAWELDPARCLMVGDQPRDTAAAAAAGVAGALFPGGDLFPFIRRFVP